MVKQMARPKKPTLIRVLVFFYCERCKAQKSKEPMGYSSNAGECEMCGSHGSTSVKVKCDCESIYDFELESW